MAEEDLPVEALQAKYLVRGVDVEPTVYWLITDKWLELTGRFLNGVYGVRNVKDEMSRKIMAALGEAGIDMSSATYEITCVPPLLVKDGG